MDVALQFSEEAFQDELKKCHMEPLQQAEFDTLFHRFLVERGGKIDWGTIHAPPEDRLCGYDDLAPVPTDPAVIAETLGKFAVCKLNGGLGTGMGCTYPKSLIELRNGMTFLDIFAKQVGSLNEKYGTKIPMILMNSFNTDKSTERALQKYKTNPNVEIKSFNQSCYPRIFRDSLLPVPHEEFCTEDIPLWYPPGHGDFFASFIRSGLLDSLIEDGVEFVFVSNVDNPAANLDLRLAHHLLKSKPDFVMEVTNKTLADVKGGTIVDVNGQLKLLEIAQVPDEHVEEFKSIRKFKVFNTNNVWINLKSLRAQRDMELEIIRNVKKLHGRDVIQLETAIGAGIQVFPRSMGVVVPRSRFLPVKSSSDLLVVQSNLILVADNGSVQLGTERGFLDLPVVKLGDRMKSVAEYCKRFPNIPDINGLTHLTVSGDVSFGRDVSLLGTVIIVADPGSHIDLPSGSIIENKVITGNLHILDH